MLEIHITWKQVNKWPSAICLQGRGSVLCRHCNPLYSGGSI